jgi:hypothetical protein
VRAVAAAVFLALALPAVAGSTNRTGLRGHVTIGPLAPVCRAGTPCTGSAKHVTLSFRHVFRVWKATTDGSGNYRIALGPGSYVLTANRGMSVRPAVVAVAAGRVRVVNLAIDTGIR